MGGEKRLKVKRRGGPACQCSSLLKLSPPFPPDIPFSLSEKPVQELGQVALSVQSPRLLKWEPDETYIILKVGGGDLELF